MTRDEARERIAHGLAASPIGQVLVERSLLGWYEIEFEVLRDASDTTIAICGMENLDPMGVHTGDSIVVAPIQTLPDPVVQRLRRCALKIVRALRLEGGCNVQLAVRPDGGDYRVIEVNPRVSRSSALASKATGYPIARIAALIALGQAAARAAEPRHRRRQRRLRAGGRLRRRQAAALAVRQVPDRRIARSGVQMKATGEAMAIDREFGPALLKAVRSLEPRGRGWLWEDPAWGLVASASGRPRGLPGAERHAAVADGRPPAPRLDRCRRADAAATGHRAVVHRAAGRAGRGRAAAWSARRCSTPSAPASATPISRPLSGVPAVAVRRARVRAGIAPAYRRVDTCAGEFPAETPYFYSSLRRWPRCAPPAERRSVIVVGSGPIRIGQGIEFDYCSVRAAWAIREMGLDAVVINNNPETVSTDYDACIRLYFEPLDTESRARRDRPRAGAHRRAAARGPHLRRPDGDRPGQGPGLRRCADRRADRRGDRDRPRIGSGSPRCSTSWASRGRAGGSRRTTAELRRRSRRSGLPVIVRPSWVIGGRGIAVLRDPRRTSATTCWPPRSGGRCASTRWSTGIELDVDVISDGSDWCVPGHPRAARPARRPLRRLGRGAPAAARSRARSRSGRRGGRADRAARSGCAASSTSR